MIINRVLLSLALLVVAESRAPIRLIPDDLKETAPGGVVFKKPTQKARLVNLLPGGTEEHDSHMEFVRSLINNGGDGGSEVQKRQSRFRSLGKKDDKSANSGTGEKIVGQVSMGPNFSGYTGKFSNDTINKIADKDEIAYIEEELPIKLHTQYNVPSYGLQKMSSMYGNYYADSCTPASENPVGDDGSGDGDVDDNDSLNKSDNLQTSRYKKKKRQNKEEKTEKSKTGVKAILNDLAVKTETGMCLALKPGDDPSSKKAYYFDEPIGENVNIYIIDSGIDPNHSDFEGRVKQGLNLVTDEENTDNYHHGTHVAGISSGKTFGVSKKANLISVKMFTKDGGVVQGGFLVALDWVLKDYKERVNSGGSKLAILNLSLGTKGKSEAFNSAIDSLVEAGIVVVVSAGNDSEDACSYTPASNKNTITVGATDSNDYIADFSNFGECIDIFAPGVG
ncbi:Subtilisin-like protease [Smittium culicis]|uniref:Subtilisin-like protease n=1 Tax=Smittium culicis TaxID=133412 RepID=A0A1R1X1V1_9FUNG|nr:Subtilisin-like protease [Smittium culicis]